MPWKLPPDQNAMSGVFGMGEEVPPWLQAGMLGPASESQSWPADIKTPRLRRIQENRPAAWDPEPSADAAMMGLAGGPAGWATRTLMASPKVATALLAGYYGLSGTDPAGGAEDDAVKQLQMKLRDSGLYSGPIDGKMGPGTQRAQQQQQQADQLRVQQQGATASQTAAEAQRRAAEAQIAETQRQSEAAAAEAQNQTAGAERYNQAENNVGPVSSALRSYGAPIGTTLGILAGPLARLGVTKASNAMSRGTAAEAESLMANVPKGTPQRVANVNEFWRRGGQGEAVPFLNTADKAPGFAANPGAAGMDKLFQPNAVKNALTDAGIVGGFGAEAGAMKYMSGVAGEELQRATDAAQKNPSQINIDRLQQAKDKVAFYDSMMNVGRAGAVAYPASMLKMQRSPTTPNMAGAEAERLKLEAILRRRSPVAEALAKPQSQMNGYPSVPPAFSGPSAWAGRQRQ